MAHLIFTVIDVFAEKSDMHAPGRPIDAMYCCQITPLNVAMCSKLVEKFDEISDFEHQNTGVISTGAFRLLARVVA